MTNEQKILIMEHLNMEHLNMEQENKNIKIIFSNSEKNTPALVEKENGSGYVSYGDDNKFPDYLFNLYTKSSTMKSIVDSIVDYSSDFEILKGDVIIDEDVVERIIFDYVVFGGFALQVNEKNGLKKLKYIDFKNLRTNKNKNNFWYSQEWTKYRSKSINLPLYDPKQHYDRSIFYFSGKNKRDGKVYPIPRCSGALEDIETNIEISNFWKNSILNNLDSSAIISFNNGIPSEEIQKEIEAKINKKFTGTDNAGKTIVTFTDTQEQAPTIQRLESDNFDTKYNSLVSTVEQRIFTAFRINPILCGINVQTGFSKEEFIDAYNLAYITVIRPVQKSISHELEKLNVNVKFNKIIIYEDGTSVEDANV